MGDPSSLWSWWISSPWEWSVHFVDFVIILTLVIHPLCGLCKLFTLRWSVHFVDFVIIFTLWVIRPLCGFVHVGLQNSRPIRTTRPFCGLCLISVHVLTSNPHPFGTIRPLCGLVMYPSTLWTLCSLSIHNKNPCGKSKLYLNILL